MSIKNLSLKKELLLKSYLRWVRPFAQIKVHDQIIMMILTKLVAFKVGYEMLANCQRDLTAEQAADKLRY